MALLLLLLLLLPNSIDGHLTTLTAWQTLDQEAQQHVHHIKTFSVNGTFHAIALVPFFWSDLHWFDRDINSGNVWNFWRWNMTSERFSPYPFTPTHTECVSDYEPVELNGAMYLVEASVIPRATSPCGQNAKLFRWNGSGWAEQTDIPPILVKDSWKVKAMNLGGTVHLVFSPAAQHGDKMTLWRFNGRAFELVQEFPEIKRKQYLYWSVTHIDNEVYFVVGIWPLVMRRRLSLLEEEPFDAAAGTRNHSGASLLPRGLNGNTPQPTFNVVVFRYTGTAFEVYQTWGNNPGCGKLQGVTCKPGCSGIITTIIDGKHYLLEPRHRWFVAPSMER